MNIDLGATPPNAVEFYIRRSQAMDAYGAVEQSLSSILALLLGSDQKAAAVIFFQLTNTRSRCRIIEDLLVQRYKDRYVAYWHGVPNTAHRKGLVNLIVELDATRNQIVHWHTVNMIGGDENSVAMEYVLMPPNFWVHTNSDTKLTADGMKNFTTKASFVSRSMNMFRVILDPQTATSASDLSEPWHEIFQQPCVYPPAVGHPLLA